MAILAADMEEALSSALLEGRGTARKAFFDVFKGYLASVCRRYLDEDDVKDVLQDVFVKIFTKAGSFSWRGPGSLQAWARQIAVNESLALLRKQSRESKVPLDSLPEGADDESPGLAPELAEEDDSPAEGVPAEVLMEMIRKLPPQYRAVFNMYVLDDMSHKEIAAELGISEVTSASNLSRAKKSLAKMINEYFKTASKSGNL